MKFVERLPRTLLDEHFRVMKRTQLDESVEDMQKDLDAYLSTYNTEHAPSGPRHEWQETCGGLRPQVSCQNPRHRRRKNEKSRLN